MNFVKNMLKENERLKQEKLEADKLAKEREDHKNMSTCSLSLRSLTLGKVSCYVMKTFKLPYGERGTCGGVPMPLANRH